MSSVLNVDVEPKLEDLLSTSMARKRELGAFYTPSSVTKVLCDWAIQSSKDIVLEPSFGGCNFLEASVSRMLELGESSISNIFGCDIDPTAFNLLKAKIPNFDTGNFHLRDFLLMNPDDIPGGGVDTVIGNPPYVRYSKLDEEQRSSIHRWEEQHNLRLNRRASLWTYFSFHALKFLKVGGRIAWVLPVSFMTAQYASGLRDIFFEKFKRIAFFTLTERIFLSEGTEERALIVMADGYGQAVNGAHVTSRYLDSLNDLKREVDSWGRGAADAATSDGRSNFGIVSGDVDSVMSKLTSRSEVKLLGDIASIGIGVVSGNSKFFIKSHQEWRKLGVGFSHLSYIMPRSRYVTGLSVSESDRLTHQNMGVSCFALDVPLNTKALKVLGYLSTYDKESLASNATFAKRHCWYRFLDDQKPDAFMVFMTHLGPRIILNEAQANATNAMYRVNFEPKYQYLKKLALISLQTTFSQLESERLGRARGSGALKLEPFDAKRIPICLPDKPACEVDIVFKVIDKHMRSGDEERARKAADEFIFLDLPYFIAELGRLESSLLTARRRRIRSNEKTFTDE